MVRSIAMIVVRRSGLIPDLGPAKMPLTRTILRQTETDKTVFIRPQRFRNPNWPQAKLPRL